MACKALLLRVTGSFPKSHTVAGALARCGAMPPGVEGRALHRLLADFTLGTYGFEKEITSAEVEAALVVAKAMVAHAARR